MSNIGIVAADGTGTPMTLANRLELEHRGHPSWSPDGTMLALDGSISPRVPVSAPEIFVVNADGTGSMANLTNHPARDLDPDWQPVNPIPYGLVDPASGFWHLRGAAGTVREFHFGNPGDAPFVGDWDCDGNDTPGLYRQADGFVYLRNSNAAGIADIRFFFGDPDDVALAGDFNGDGCDTVSLYRPSEQRFYIVNKIGPDGGGLGEADFFFTFGNPGDAPVVGDWDGDGIEEAGLHRETTGLFYWRDTLDSGIADGQILFGNPIDRFIAGDWTGDQLDTVATFRPSDGRLYARNTITQGVADSVFVAGTAKSTWLPLTGSFGFT